MGKPVKAENTLRGTPSIVELKKLATTLGRRSSVLFLIRPSIGASELAAGPVLASTYEQQAKDTHQLCVVCVKTQLVENQQVVT